MTDKPQWLWAVPVEFCEWLMDFDVFGLEWRMHETNRKQMVNCLGWSEADECYAEWWLEAVHLQSEALWINLDEPPVIRLKQTTYSRLVDLRNWEADQGPTP